MLKLFSQNREWKRDLARPKGSSKYPEKTQFMVAVLWLRGLSMQSISLALTAILREKISKGSVKTMIEIGAYSDRGSMAMDERNKILAFLKEHRIDDGILLDINFRAMALDGRQS